MNSALRHRLLDRAASLLRIAVATALVATASAAAAAPPGCDAECRRVASTVDPVIGAEMKRSAIPGAAFVFVHSGRIVYERGYGVSDLAARTPVDPRRTIWPIASITKTVTALAAMQLVQAGKIGLDTDVNRYLRRLNVPSAGYGPLTLRHLLSHTGGLDELPGRQFDGRSPPRLADFLRTRLVRYRAPGKLTAYSTYGIALTGVLVEDVSGLSYANYMRRNIFQPAGMASARVMGRIGDERGVATAYDIANGTAREAAREWYVTTPTSSVAATAHDMAKLLIAHLDGGRVAGRSLLSARWIDDMHRQQATNHPALPGWGLGFQLDRVNGVAIAEHGGDIGGFSALFVLMPTKGTGFFVVNHGEGNDLRFKVKEALIDALYPDPHPARAPAPDPNKAAELREYAGRYLSSVACRSCPDEQQVFEVEAKANGTLSLWGQTWVPLRPDLFIRDDGKRLLGFTRDTGGTILSVTGGSWRVADKIEERRSPP